MIEDIARYCAMYGIDGTKALLSKAKPAEPPLPYSPPVARDWLSTPPEPTPFLIEPYLAHGRRHTIFAETEGGKSITAQYWTALLTRQSRKVVYVSAENPSDEDRSRFYRLGADMNHLDLFQHMEMETPIDLNNVEHAEGFVNVSCKGADLVVLDTLTACWGGDENSNAEIALFDRQILAPLAAQGAAVLVLDHVGHQQAFVKRTGANAGRGAISKGQKVDVTFRFIPKSDERGMFEIEPGKYRITGRPRPPKTLMRVIDTATGGLDIEPLGVTDDIKVEEAANAIVEIVTAQDAMTVRELREAMKGLYGTEVVSKALKSLESEDPPRARAKDELFDPGTGRKRRSKVWRLVDESEPEQEGLI
ncbi:MAG: AAA family ATPase [Actinomycetota bacterium]